MTLRERLRQIDRLQNTKTFKIIASCVVIALGIAGFVSYVVAQNAPTAAGAASEQVPSAEKAAPAEPKADAPRSGAGEAVAAAAAPKTDAIDEANRILDEIVSVQADPTTVGVQIGIVCALLVAVIWLGLGLTAVALAFAALAVVYPLFLFDSTRGFARLLAGILALTGSFLVMMRLLVAAFSAPGPVWAIARNVLAEAVRLKVSSVFIVLLILGLAALPSLLDSASPLRYRIQTFLQYGTGGSFALIAILTLVFSVSTVAFEQRDKTIWQTITKPVPPWKFLLGKWIGVMGLNLVLLAVCGSAVFLFTEYLRGLPANGETVAYAADEGPISEDRLILETQVLSSRIVANVLPPQLNYEPYEKNVKAKIDEVRATNPDPSKELSPEVIKKIREDLYKSVVQSYLAIEPGKSEVYVFSGLGAARGTKSPILFRYRINSGTNQPDKIYRLTMAFAQEQPIVRQTGLGYFHTVPLLPSAVDNQGNVTVEIYNGDIFAGTVNAESISFPPDGLQLFYTVGSFRVNFVRVMLVLWVKLAFLSMLAICASTCLSFPVACLVAFGTFMCAESATFLSEALEYFPTTDDKGGTLVVSTVIGLIGRGVANLFSIYSELKPTTHLVDGTLLSWGSVAGGMAVLGGAVVLLYGISILIFRRRELALYSGH